MTVRRRLSRLVRRHRRALAAATAALAVLAGLQAAETPGPASRWVPVAGHDLPAGHVVTDGDLTLVAWQPEAVPDGVLTDPAGAVLTAPVRRGEPLTDVRVARAPGAGGIAGASVPVPAGRLPMALHLTDGAAGALLHAGQKVDVLATDPQAPQQDSADVVTAEVPLLSITDGSGSGQQGGSAPVSSGLLGLATDGGSATAAAGNSGMAGAGVMGDGAGGEGMVLVVAVTPAQAARLAAAQAARVLTVIGHPAG